MCENQHCLLFKAAYWVLGILVLARDCCSSICCQGCRCLTGVGWAQTSHAAAEVSVAEDIADAAVPAASVIE